jgi:hypothetical protein
MLVLSTKLGLKTAQADITAAFVHADLKQGEDIYVQQPKGMERGTGLVLKLKKSVYGLKQAPRYFFTHLSKKMELCGLKQSNKDPCLFIGKTVIAVVYVDDVLFYSKSNDEIDRIITSLRNDHNILIRREGVLVLSRRTQGWCLLSRDSPNVLSRHSVYAAPIQLL